MLSSSGYCSLQPSGNLFRRPVQDQFTRNDLLQLPVNGQKAPLGPQGRLPGLVIGFIGSIHEVARHGGPPLGSPSTPPAATPWLSRESTKPQAIPREMFSRSASVSVSRRAPTRGRSNPAVLRQHKLNGHMVLAEGPSNLMQRLSRLPTAHMSVRWIAESFTRLRCVINTTFREKIYSRWCCIDRLSWQDFTGLGASCHEVWGPRITVSRETDSCYPSPRHRDLSFVVLSLLLSVMLLPLRRAFARRLLEGR